MNYVYDSADSSDSAAHLPRGAAAYPALTGRKEAGELVRQFGWYRGLARPKWDGQAYLFLRGRGSKKMKRALSGGILLLLGPVIPGVEYFKKEG